MTDRELLELAAKAAGMTLGAWSERRLAFMYRDASPGPGYWNPLTDDGDALRLAVKLMEYEPYKSRGYLPCISTDAEQTRRAIVRAAAAIGSKT